MKKMGFLFDARLVTVAELVQLHARNNIILLTVSGSNGLVLAIL